MAAKIVSAFKKASSSSSKNVPSSTKSVINTKPPSSQSNPNNSYKMSSSSGGSSMTDYQRNEVIRKAQSGIALDKPTPEKDALYKQYAKASSGGGGSFTSGGGGSLGSIGKGGGSFTSSGGGVIGGGGSIKDWNKTSGGAGGSDFSNTMRDALTKAKEKFLPPEPPTWEDMYGKFDQSLSDIMNPFADWTKMFQQYAEQQSQAQFNQQKTSLESLIKNLTNQQESQLMGINNGVKDAESALEDRSFQDYLSTRQAMSNRGLSGSGIAADADTRLMLDKQRSMAGIYRDAEQQRFDVSSRLGQQMEDAYKQIAALNPEATESEIFMKMFQGGQETMLKQAGLYGDMLKEMMGYDRIPLSKQAELDLERYGIDSKNMTDKEIATMNNLTQFQIAQMQDNTDRYGMDINYQIAYMNDLTQRYGIDADTGIKLMQANISMKELEVSALKAGQDYNVDMSNASGYLVKGIDANGNPIFVKDSSGNLIPTAEKTKIDQDFTIKSGQLQINLADVQSKISDRLADNTRADAQLEFDWAELEVQTEHWANQDANNAELTRLKGEELLRKIDSDAATVAIAQDKAQSTKNGQALKAAIAEMNQLGGIMKSEIGKSKDGKPSKKTKEAYAKAQQKVNSLVSQLGADAGSGGGSGSDFQMGLDGGW